MTVDPARSSPLAGTVAALAQRLPAAEELLFGIDFEGALAPAARRPEDAIVAPESRRYLRALGEDERVTAVVCSGRALADVRARVGVEGLTYAGNRGLELCHRRRTSVHPCAERHWSRVQRLRRAVADALAHVPGVTVENAGWTAVIRYRDAPEDRVPEIRETVRAVVERRGDGRLELRRCREAVELRPAVDWDRGRTLGLLAERCADGCLPVYVGDGSRDEPAFRAVQPRGIGVRVGDGASRADEFVRDSREVAALLGWLSTAGIDALGAGRRQ